MKYIHYGHDSFDINKFTKITNNEYCEKPVGGLWASRVDAKYGWKEYIEGNFTKTDQKSYKLNLNFTFSLSPETRILLIDEIEQVRNFPKKLNSSKRPYHDIDFELLSKYYDVIEISLAKDEKLLSLGWDCDSIVIMNPEVIELD